MIATTVSQAQFDFAKARVESSLLADCIDLRLEDYRDLEEVFDKVVSVEMIEAIGHEFLPGYFRRLQELVKPEGLVAIQGFFCQISIILGVEGALILLRSSFFRGVRFPPIGPWPRLGHRRRILHCWSWRNWAITTRRPCAVGD